MKQIHLILAATALVAVMTAAACSSSTPSSGTSTPSKAGNQDPGGAFAPDPYNGATSPPGAREL